MRKLAYNTLQNVYTAFDQRKTELCVAVTNGGIAIYNDDLNIVPAGESQVNFKAIGLKVVKSGLVRS